MSDTLLTLRDVHINFPVRKNWLGKTTEHVHAINGIDLQIRRGETLGIVGESGCGKSTLAQLLMGMLQPSHGQYIRSGSQRIMQMVFQDPLSSLNPRLPVWRVITEPLWIAKRSSEQQRRALAEELAVQVGIRPEYLDRLPHAFSGGQRQRIAIARALSSQPDVIVLDEPTSALDISVQAQILNLLVTLQENHGLTYVLISHNVSVIRHMSDRVAVMYLGQIVELGDAQQVLTAPAHPYTRLLLDSLPAIDKPLEEEWALRKTDLPGNRTLPQGCFFYERCPLATHGCEVRQSLAIREADVSSGAGGRCRDANNASGIHAPDASSGNALRFQLVIQRNFRFQYLRDRASCFCFLDDAVKGRGINTRHRNFTLQCDFRNRKTGIHFIQRHIGGGINRCWRESRFPQH